MRQQKWKIRFHSSADGEAILELLNAVFESWGSMEKWKWKFHPPVVDARSIIGIAEDDEGRVVGTWSVLPLMMKVGGRTVIGSQALDAATHRDFRRMGILNKLVPFVLNEAKESGIPIAYGIGQGFVTDAYLGRHGAILVENIPNLIRVLDYKDFLGKRYHSKFTFQMAEILLKSYVRVLHGFSRLHQKRAQKGFVISEVENFDSSIDRIWEQASEEFDVMTVRDAKYLNWRYVDCLDGGYKIWTARNQDEVVGYVVAKHSEQERAGYILDLLTLPEYSSSAQSLISTAMQFFKKKDASWIQCWMPRFSRYSKYLRRSGFMRTRTDLRLLCHILNPSSLRLPPKPRWFLTLGDCDMV